MTRKQSEYFHESCNYVYEMGFTCGCVRLCGDGAENIGGRQYNTCVYTYVFIHTCIMYIITYVHAGIG